MYIIPKTIIVIFHSCVGEVGFLKEDRRINVAVTRARRHLFIVGDSTTISHHPFLESMCAYLFDNADLRSPRYDDQQFGLDNAVPLDTTCLELKALLNNEKTLSLETSLLNVNQRPSDARRFGSNKKTKDETRKVPTSRSDSKSKYTHTEQRADSCDVNEVTDEQLKEQIQDFLNTSKAIDILEFPTTLTPRQRAFVHEAAESSNLHHESVGQGHYRRIVLRKAEPENNVSLDKEKHGKRSFFLTCHQVNVNCHIT